MPHIDPFQEQLQNPNINQEIIEEIQADNEKSYLRELKKKNKGFLVEGLDMLSRQRIAKYICNRFKEMETKHDELCDRIDEYDEVYRMERKEIPGSDGDMPNYRSPLSTVSIEVTHANVMNVFHTPSDIMSVIPTEEGDVPKVNKLSTFGNWSSQNELSIFEKTDRMFHNSSKVGESPYILHWVKEYGTDIKREIIFNPADPSQPLYDPDTQEPLFQEVEEQKLLYNGPRLDIFSRKDYFQPENSLMDHKPEWEGRRIRMTYDKYLREELAGRMFAGSIKEIKDWGSEDSTNTEKVDYEGDTIPVGKWEKEFREWYGRLRINIVKKDDEDNIESTQELEDEFIALVNIESETLCQLRKNKFPLKERPIGVDYFIPDDEGRRRGIGIIEFLEGPQKAYDVMYNQFIYGTMQSNNPFGFFTPMGNQRHEAIKIQNGFLYPTSDPNSVNIVKLPPPDNSLQLMLELVRNWAQLLFGISDFTAGVESQIDPDAPAKKAQIVVAQGNVRMNLVIKRKNKTLQDIFRRWFLLYQANMPPNKFMRIVGDSKDNPWKFEGVTLEDFALKSIPDFQLTGNILNANKTLEANKALAIYNVMIANPFFSPQTRQGLLALHQLTKWLIDKLEETGLSRFLPPVPGEIVHTPEEENARFLQGDSGEPTQGEDHINHIRVHSDLINDPLIPDEIKEKIVVPHITRHIQIMQEEFTQQAVLQQAGINPAQAMQAGQSAPQSPVSLGVNIGGGNGRTRGNQFTQGTVDRVVPE